MNKSREQTLKNIVFDVNKFIKMIQNTNKQKKYFTINDLLIHTTCKNLTPQNKCNGFYLKLSKNTLIPTQYECICSSLRNKYQNLNSNNLTINKIESNWPLKKGMVNTKFIAWHKVMDAKESIQYSIAFMIKCVSVSLYKSKEFYKDTDSNFIIYFNEIISNIYSSLFFWSEIRNYYIQNSLHSTHDKKSRLEFYNKIMPKKKLVVLCLENSFFKLRSGTNLELFAFEQFINDLSSTDNSLIIFSKQKLLPENFLTNKYTSNYSISFKNNIDESKYSIQEAMEPDFKVVKDERFIDANKTGSFDRLIELLAKGQIIINSIEQDFLEWKLMTNS